MNVCMDVCMYVNVCMFVCVYVEWDLDLFRTLYAAACHCIVLTDSLTVCSAMAID
jgi:hypothetical protein